MQTRSQRQFEFFMKLCEEWYDDNRDYDEWYDRVALSWVLQCHSYHKVWEAAIVPYNETYFRGDSVVVGHSRRLGQTLRDRTSRCPTTQKPRRQRLFPLLLRGVPPEQRRRHRRRRRRRREPRRKD